MFLLVLRQMPRRFAADPVWAPKVVRLAISVGVGCAVAAFAVMVSAARRAPSVGGTYAELSLPEAGGNNIVNVILVDFRGVDTLGEITVLATAALGVTNLVRMARRARARAARGDRPVAARGRERHVIGRRSQILDEADRWLFPVILLVSVYVAAPWPQRAGRRLRRRTRRRRGVRVAVPRRRCALGAPLRRSPGRRRSSAPACSSLPPPRSLRCSSATHCWSRRSGRSTSLRSATVKIVSSAIFDVGVYLLVVGVVLAVLLALGADPIHRDGGRADAGVDAGVDAGEVPS